MKAARSRWPWGSHRLRHGVAWEAKPYRAAQLNGEPLDASRLPRAKCSQGWRGALEARLPRVT